MKDENKFFSICVDFGGANLSSVKSLSYKTLTVIMCVIYLVGFENMTAYVFILSNESPIIFLKLYNSGEFFFFI